MPTTPKTSAAKAARTDNTAPPMRRVLAALSLCMLLPSLGISVANVALPTMAEAFGATFAQVQWVVLAYLLASTSLVVGAGRLGDLLGRRRLLVAGITLFTLASVGCGLAPTLGWLQAARAAQGLGAATMMALTMAFVGEAVPRSHTGRAMGLLGTMSAVGTALGPSLGGLLLAGFGWRAIFCINLPLGLLALWLAQRYLPAGRAALAASPARFDALGTLLLALTLAAYALALTLGTLKLSLLAAAVLGLALFIVRQARAASPLIPLADLREPAFAISLVTSVLVSAVIMATMVVGPFYLAHGLGLATALVGAVLSIGPVVAALSGVPAGRLVDRFGAPSAVVIGLAGMLLGCVAIASVAPSAGITGYAGAIVVTTMGYALFQAANNTAVMAGVPADQRGVVSGLLTLSRNLGLITGAAVMGAVFATSAGPSDIGSGSPADITHGLRATFALAAGLMLLALVVAMAAASLTRVKKLSHRFRGPFGMIPPHRQHDAKQQGENHVTPHQTSLEN